MNVLDYSATNYIADAHTQEFDSRRDHIGGSERW
jgi:hypothetical protein